MLALKELREVLTRHGHNMGDFYSNFVNKVEAYEETGVGISLQRIIPEKIYVLATIVYRIDQTDEMINQKLKRG